MIGLTKKQREVLDYIRTYATQNGFSPSVGEVATYFAISAPSALMHLRALHKKGMIDRGEKARSIVLKSDNIPTLPTPTQSQRMAIPLFSSPNDMSIKHVPKSVFISPEFISSISFRQLFGIKVTPDFALLSAGILPNDILVLKYAAIAEPDQCVIANFEGTFILGKISRRGKTVVIKTDKKTYNNLPILGILVGLERFFN